MELKVEGTVEGQWEGSGRRHEEAKHHGRYGRG